MSRKSENESESDTNFGWWVDKPDRPERQSTLHANLEYTPRPARGFSWRIAVLVVLLMIAFAWSLKSLAGW